MFIDFRERERDRERERRRERERERNIDVGERETLIGCLPHVPNQGLNPQPFGVQGDPPAN